MDIKQGSKAWFAVYGECKIQLDEGEISIEDLYQKFAVRKSLETLEAIDEMENIK